MNYVIEWRPSARKEVRKLDPPIRRRAIAAVEALAGEPVRLAQSCSPILPAGGEFASAITA